MKELIVFGYITGNEGRGNNRPKSTEKSRIYLMHKATKTEPREQISKKSSGSN